MSNQKNKQLTKAEQEFEKILQQAEDPQNLGQGSGALPRNATPLEKTKYDLCQTILAYLMKQKITDQAIAQKVNGPGTEVEDILFCRVRKFSLDKLVDLANQLLAPCEIVLAVKESPSAYAQII